MLEGKPLPVSVAPELEPSNQLLPEVYAELRRLAAARLAHEKPGQTLQATALVHEAWLRVAGSQVDAPKWKSREHFFGAAAEAMRRILIENARRKKAVRHGGGKERIELEGLQIGAPEADDDILAVSEALDLLAEHDRTKAEVVKLHYFAGLTFDEIASVLEVSTPTVKRHWAYARAWLFRKVKQLKIE
jgi:RNA polymerase sigma factor (TIGR02999 family)